MSKPSRRTSAIACSAFGLMTSGGCPGVAAAAVDAAVVRLRQELRHREVRAAAAAHGAGETAALRAAASIDGTLAARAGLDGDAAAGHRELAVHDHRSARSA